jgi:predicted transcriptional regulator
VLVAAGCSEGASTTASGDLSPLVKKIAIAIMAKPITIATGIAVDDSGWVVGSINNKLITWLQNQYIMPLAVLYSL